MLNFENVGSKSLVVSLDVSGLPLVTYPSVGNEMSNGVEVTESNQKEYTSTFSRDYDECTLLDFEVDYMELSTIKGNSRMTIEKDFTNTTDEDIETFVNGLSELTIKDESTDEIYNAKVTKVVEYDIQDI